MFHTDTHIVRAGAPLLAALLLGAPAAVAQPASMTLRGVIRDFRSVHPDFAPGLPIGHVAGITGMELSGDKPVYGAAGYEVNSEWRDMAGRPIAPHMYFVGTVVARLAGEPTLSQSSYIDAFDFTTGEYDPATAGEAAFMTGAEMPTLTEPAMSVAHQRYFIREKNYTSTLSRDVHADVFRVKNQHTLMIEGDVTILVEDWFEVSEYANISLASGASLKLYLKGRAIVAQHSGINENTGDPSLVEIYNLGTQPFSINNYTDVYASIVSPNAPLTMYNNTDFFGPVTAQNVYMSNSSGLHVSGEPNICGLKIDDEQGVGGSSGAIVDSANTFAQWFTDVQGVNASRANTIVLRDRGASGMFEFFDPSFFPIDGKLYGNEGEEHNYRFTYEIPATFVYNQCAGQSFWFEGTDDCWVFIDDKLVLDIGGVQPGTGQHIDLDRLDLVDGQTYSFRLFYAHRTSNTPRFSIRTNIDLIAAPITAGMVGYPRYD